MCGYTVTRTEKMRLEAPSPLCFMYMLSPFVWREGNGYRILVRAVNHSPHPAEKVARVYAGRSDDGLTFAMGDHPVIVPGTGPEDKDGCEDPTVVRKDGRYYVWYTGWNQTTEQGRLMLATGEGVEHLEKRGVALPWTESRANPKEATVVQVADGSCRLFFEYARDGASRIGVARAGALEGPWENLGDPFEPREDRWDNWHLSTGPILLTDPEHPVMFYNGATKDAHWRIGWVVFDADYTEVLARSEEPLVTPPPQDGDATDIAFAASAVEAEDGAWLYYSIADKELLRATLQQACP